MTRKEALLHLAGTIDHIAYNVDGDPDLICCVIFDMIRCLTNDELLAILDADDEADKVEMLKRWVRFDKGGRPHRRGATPAELAAQPSDN